MILAKAKYFIIISFTAWFILSYGAKHDLKGNTMKNSKPHQIKIVTSDTTLSASLDDNATSRDFISLLPLELTLEDYAGTEKISALPKKLSLEDAPSGYDPSVGDITYYAPWGNLAIFYNDFGYANGLIKLGNISNGIEALRKETPIQIRIERSK